MKKLFNFNSNPSCEYCKFGRVSPGKQMILCVKKGIMKPESSCASFKYDPLKRKPKPKSQIFTDFSEDEFSL